MYAKSEKVEGHTIYLYYWDDRNGQEYRGWWFGYHPRRKRGIEGWAYNLSREKKPPTEGWKQPWEHMMVNSTLSVVDLS